MAVTKVADDRSYHPIREMFASLPAWDGVKRVDSLLIDYLGAEDNEYVRAVIVDNICVAEELMQETFVRLAVKKPKFKGKMYFKTWLYSIAKHCALDYLRKSSKMADFPIDEAFLMSDEEDIERQYLKEEQKIELHRAMRRLKPEYAQVLYFVNSHYG